LALIFTDVYFSSMCSLLCKSPTKTTVGTVVFLYANTQTPYTRSATTKLLTRTYMI
jgi:hypothetical protein